MTLNTINHHAELKRTWVTHPTKINLAIVLAVWVVSTLLLVLTMTDLFTASIFNKKYLMIYVMLITSTLTTFKVVYNYFRTSKSERKR